LEVPVDVVAQGLEKVTCVPGRLEPVEAGQPFTVLVDYAHTDDGLRNVLQAVRTLRPHRVITVFGCGGDRDKTKRPKMAEAVAEGSDFAVLTSDNPRTEDPYAILQDAEAGFLQAQWQRDKNYAVIPDRRRAIEYALNYAQPGDVVLIAGKGHETYQIIGREYFPFDDREVAGEILTQRYKHGMDV
jgi:UDP-N-acetylmuramyl-tripeptide synthetase